MPSRLREIRVSGNASALVVICASSVIFFVSLSPNKDH